MESSDKRQLTHKVLVPAYDTKYHIPKHDGTNISRHTILQVTFINWEEDLLKKKSPSSRMIPGGKTAHTPKLLNAYIPKLLVPPGRITNNKGGEPLTTTNSLHNPDPTITPVKNKYNH